MLDTVLADKLSGIAVEQIKAAFRFKKGRMDQIKKNEDAYMNVKDNIPGNLTISMPVMGGFTDTLISKLNNPIKINFDKQEEADYRKALKMQSKWEYDSAPTRGAWKIKDLLGKKMAALSGVAIFYKASMKKEKRFIDILRNVDHNHFYCEPKKGYDLETHRYLGETNIWKSAADLDEGVKSGIYNEAQVIKIKANLADENRKVNEELYNSNKHRYEAMNLSNNENFEGDDIYCLTNHLMEYKGKRYYIFLDYNTGTWIRAEELEEMFSKPTDFDNPLWPYQAWHTHPDISNFWSKGPADDVLSIHGQIGLILTYAFKNLKQRIQKKRAIDPEVFPDASEIEDEITQTIEVNPLMQGKSIGEGVYEFQTEDNTRIIVNLVSFLNGFLGEQTGITPGSKGRASEERVTIYLGNIEQVANRMGLYSEFYQQCWAILGLLYFIGVKDNYVSGQLVKTLGLNGYEFEEFLSEDASPLRDFDIRITGGTENAEVTKEKEQTRRDSLILAVKEYKQFMNPMKVIENVLKAGGWDDEDIKALQDTDIYGNRVILSEAAEAIQEVIKGENPKVNRGANEAFVMKIINWADDHEEDLEDDQYEKLYAYANLHLSIVARNSARKAMMIAQMQGAGAMFGLGEQPTGGRVPAEGAPVGASAGGMATAV